MQGAWRNNLPSLARALRSLLERRHGGSLSGRVELLALPPAVRERSHERRRRSISDCSKAGRVVAKQIQQSMPSARKESWTASRSASLSLLSSAPGAGWAGLPALASLMMTAGSSASWIRIMKSISHFIALVTASAPTR